MAVNPKDMPKIIRAKVQKEIEDKVFGRPKPKLVPLFSEDNEENEKTKLKSFQDLLNNLKTFNNQNN